MAEVPRVSEETKNRLLKEKQRIDEEASRYIRRVRMYRRFIFLLPIQLVLYIPFLIAISYFFNGLDNLWTLPITISYMGGMYFFVAWEMTRRTKSLSKTICLYASVSSAEALESGEIAKGSFFAVRLFEFIKSFSEGETVKLGHFKCTLKNLFLGDIEKLHEQRSAIGKSILANPTRRLDFSNNLYILARSLFSVMPLNLDDGVTVLRFFANESKNYFEPATFLQKHKKVATTTKVFSEIGKITLVPILLFILWFLFGYR